MESSQDERFDRKTQEMLLGPALKSYLNSNKLIREATLVEASRGMDSEAPHAWEVPMPRLRARPPQPAARGAHDSAAAAACNLDSAAAAAAQAAAAAAVDAFACRHADAAEKMPQTQEEVAAKESTADWSPDWSMLAPPPLIDGHHGNQGVRAG
mmetsp:Transcript_138698/g.254449  ORF Transcript_138698/g.254449 Transcript_138698/m.254449 type:complete len:154 (-) Transcript_138698:12-473(-)